MAAKSTSPTSGQRAREDWQALLTERRHDLLVITACVLLASVAGWVFREYAPDDAFITYRFARNLALGRGFAYNPGEPVLGTSTPFYTLFLAAGHWLTRIDIPSLSHVVGVIALAGASVIFYRLGRDYDPQLALVATLLFAANPILLASLGMEALFLLLCQLAALTAFGAGKRAVSAVMLGVLILLRYEMVLFAGLIALADLLQSRRIPWWIWPAGAIVGTWLFFAQTTFGQVIPQSAVAKLAAHRLPFLVGGLVIWDIYARQLPAFYLLLILAVLGLYSLARTRLRDLAPAYRLLIAWGGVYLIAAGLLAGSFPWYYAPLVPAATIFVGAGVRVLIEMLLEVVPAGRARLVGVTAYLILIGGLVHLHTSAWTRAWVVGPQAVVDARVLAYQEFASWLNDNAPPGASLASFEIGAIGYYSNLYIIDLAGLITPEMLPWVRQPDRANRLDVAILTFHPDYILVPQDLSGGFHHPAFEIEPEYTVQGMQLYKSLK